MRRSIVRLGTVGVVLALVAAARGAEQKVQPDKLPKPISEAVKARFNGAELTGASQETEDGNLVYEVSIKDNGQAIDVTLTPKGEILLIEKEIAAKELPKAVVKTLEDKYPQATYKKVEEIIKVEKNREKLASYEVLLTTGGKQLLEVEITPAGKIANVEKKQAGGD